jgi:transglutaminase-like putative cysteine protease
MEQLLRLPIAIERQAVQAMGGWFAEKGNQSGAAVNRGNLYPTGGERLELTLTEKPQEDIYLKNFIGGDYIGNEWRPADESDFYQSAAESGSRRIQYYFRRDFFEERQFYFIMYSKRYAGQEEDRPIRYEDETAGLGAALNIRSLSAESAARFIPYISGFQDASADGDRFNFYTRQELLDTLYSQSNENIRWYLWFERPYLNYVKETYLDAPADRTPRLAALAAQTAPGAEESVTDHILRILHSRAYYTLTPGVTPFWDDAAEYFLFENQRGYCQHFASAATLLYRMYGVPARYAAGYLAPVSAFAEQEDGTFQAVLTDASAHAWVEIYMDYIGWIPVEATPPESGEQPVLAVVSEDEIAAGANWLFRTERGVGPYAAAAGAGVVLVSLRAFKRRRGYTADRLFEKMMQTLRLGGFPKEFSGMEEGFVPALTRAAPQVGKDEADRLLELVYRDVFGRRRLSRKETEEVLRICAKVCDAVYETLNPYKKCLFNCLNTWHRRRSDPAAMPKQL